MLAPLPPSSNGTRFKVVADEATILRPTGVEPVKAILSTPIWRAKCSPATAPRPGRMLITPGGKPTSTDNLATRKAVSGVSSAGFITQQLPAARAGPSFQLTNIKGKFQGTMDPTTPTGSRST